MDDAAFEVWLLTIARLDMAQPNRALCALALAQAGGAVEAAASRDDETGLVDTCKQAAPKLRVVTDRAFCDDSLLAGIGRGRIESFGCPHCSSADVRPWGRAGGKPRYRCAECRKTFNPLTGTPLSGLHYPDRWRDQAQARISGETVSKAAARCKVAYHRIPLAAPLPGGPHSGQAAAPVWYRRSGRDVHPGSVQGQAWQAAARCAQGEAARPASGACPASRSRSSSRMIAAVPRSTPSWPVSTSPA